jgi:tRNA threonylcarbamoyladenosine biosynthesis protein TsaE
MLIPLPSLRSTQALARRIARDLSVHELILLSGELGAGKTTFVGYLAKALGIEPGWVSSPSFTIVQRYPAGPRGVGVTHVDLYRLRSAAELEGLGLEEHLASEDLVVVEWPELGEELWAASGRRILRLAFAFDAAGRRQLEWSEL